LVVWPTNLLDVRGGMLRAETVCRNVGRRIAELRRRAGQTQEEVAEGIDFSIKYQQLVESGSENLTLKTLVKFANYFQVEIAELLRPPRPPQATGARVRAKGR
jgi:transcriptional regulator with XRE-family HTH domain